MDKAALVGLDIEEGRKFLDLLKDTGVQVDAALWQKGELFGRWKLLLVTPLVEKLGLKGAYRRLDDVLSKASQRPAIDLLNVSVYTPESRFYKSLHRELRNAHDLALSGRSVGDQFLDEAFIYFVK